MELLPPQPFFRSGDQALTTLILVATWKGAGYWMVFLLAGLLGTVVALGRRYRATLESNGDIEYHALRNAWKDFTGHPGLEKAFDTIKGTVPPQARKNGSAPGFRPGFPGPTGLITTTRF